MFVLANLLAAVTRILDLLLNALEIVIFIRVILSWANADPYNGFVKFVHAVSEPFLAPFRKLFPPWKLGGWDFSPVFALLGIYFIRAFLISTLWDLVSRMK
jgi:YggT family protein